MLDPFRKRDNPRPTTPNPLSMRDLAAQPGARAPVPTPTAATQPDGAPRPDPAIAKPSLLNVPPAAPAAMPPASQAMEPTAATAAPATGETVSSARLIVGPEIKLKGAQITDCDTLIVEGEVDASMDSRVVEIAQQGIFRGKVVVDIAEVRGRFEGELTAHKRLVIRDTGKVTGKIRYGKVSIDEGGELCGDIATTEPAVTEARLPGSVRIPG